MEKGKREKIISGVIDIVKETLNKSKIGGDAKLRTQIKEYFKTYFEITIKQCSEIRNLVNKNNPSELSEIYVEPPFYFFKKNYTSFEDIEVFEKHNKILIKGTAGLGKSTLCKHLFLKFLENNENTIPLFFEFKHINNTKLTIWDFILNELELLAIGIKKDHLVELFRSGRFILIFDGLDEVEPDRRTIIDNQLRALIKESRKLRIIVSSRPDERLNFWDNFRIVRLQPFTKDKSIELIRKIEFNEKIKSEFLHLIDSEQIYSKFKSFLSNPLLTTIMFITYDEFGINALSNKRNIFYENALDALLVRHDSTKPHFHRKFISGLNPFDLKLVSEVFSILSYTDRAFTFTESQTITYLDQSRAISRLKFNSNQLLKDLTRSICLLHIDGLNYTFTHRSFQEYLSAVFLSKLEHNQRRTLLKNVLKNIETDNVIPLLYSINPQLVLIELAIPLLQDAIDGCKLLINEGKVTEAIIEYYAEFKIIRKHEYQLVFRNPNARIKLLKVITEHSDYIKSQWNSLPKTIRLRGNETTLNFLASLPTKFGKKTFKKEMLRQIKLDEIKVLKSPHTIEEVLRIYNNCLFHFKKEIKNTSKNIVDFLVKKENTI